jgi:NADH-quinone oxidoreductase subunit M
MATRRMLYGPIVHEENRHLKDLSLRECAVVVPLMVIAVWIGVRPIHFLERSKGSLDALFLRIDRARAVQTAALESERSSTEELAATESAR